MGITHCISWRVRQRVRQALRLLRGVWVTHRRLLRTTRAYEAAVAAAAAQMIIQTSWQRFITALVSGLLDIYAAIRRATRPSAGPSHGWDMP